MVFAGACSSDHNSSSEKASSRLIDFPKDRRQGVLPIDQFRLDLPRALYALDLAVYACVEGHGLQDQLAMPQPLVEEESVFSGPGGRRRFNVEIAGRFGYHTGPPDLSGPDPRFSNKTTIHKTPEGEEIYQDCRDQAMVKVPTGIDQRILQYGFTSEVAMKIQIDAGDAVGTDRDVTKAKERWRECMAPSGIADLPDDPLRMPTASMRNKYGLNTDETGEPTTDEFRVAIVDAKCRESSGYAETAYNAEWQAQVEFITKHEGDLIRAQAASDVLQRFIEDTISDYGTGSS